MTGRGAGLGGTFASIDENDRASFVLWQRLNLGGCSLSWLISSCYAMHFFYS